MDYNISLSGHGYPSKMHIFYLKHWTTVIIKSAMPLWRLRGDCLNRWVFVDGYEAQIIIEQWRQEYNHHRPHSSLRYLAPAAFADQARLSLHLD